MLQFRFYNETTTPYKLLEVFHNATCKAITGSLSSTSTLRLLQRKAQFSNLSDYILSSIYPTMQHITPLCKLFSKILFRNCEKTAEEDALLKVVLRCRCMLSSLSKRPSKQCLLIPIRAFLTCQFFPSFTAVPVSPQHYWPVPC